MRFKVNDLKVEDDGKTTTLKTRLGTYVEGVISSKEGNWISFDDVRDLVEDTEKLLTDGFIHQYCIDRGYEVENV